ncbi:hypothetical protein YC2023_049850 [Brassica napus]
MTRPVAGSVSFESLRVGKDRFPYPVGYKTVRAHNGSTYYMEIEEESYSIDSDTSDTSLEPSVLVATYEGTHDHLDQTLTLDMVHGVHVLALEKKKRGMMQEVLVQKLTTSLPTDSKFAVALASQPTHNSAEKNHEATVYPKPSEELLWVLLIQAGHVGKWPLVLNVYVPKNRVTSLHQGYGFIEFLREEDADYAIKVLYISSMERLYVLPRSAKSFDSNYYVERAARWEVHKITLHFSVHQIPAMNECFVEMVAERVIVESVISG